MKSPGARDAHMIAFTLIEVVLALAICSFVLIAILALFANGIQSNRESEQQIQAANLASLLVSIRMASPTNAIPNLPNFAIPSSAMNGPFTNAYNGGNSLTNFVGLSGQITPAATATYLISCRAGTNAATGSGVAQVYIMLSWPPLMDPSNAKAGHYEVNSYIPLQ